VSPEALGDGLASEGEHVRYTTHYAVKQLWQKTKRLSTITRLDDLKNDQKNVTQGHSLLF
jgi:hypothetical protein